jgi:hypothetical protein
MVGLFCDAQGKTSQGVMYKRRRTVILRLFMDAACCLASKELLFRGLDDSSASSNEGNFLEFLNPLKNCGLLLENHQNSATVM